MFRKEPRVPNISLKFSVFHPEGIRLQFGPDGSCFLTSEGWMEKGRAQQ